MSRGKSSTSIMRSRAANARRKTRLQSREKSYDRTKYDKPQEES
jgi:hypothetical protein